MRNYFKSLYQCYLARKDSFYRVYYQSRLLATLSNPIFKEMFWNEYTLTPLQSDEVLLSCLYDEGSWLSKEMTFIGHASGLAYHFYLSFEAKLSDRPTSVLLRGPYLTNNHLESQSRIA